MQTPVLINPKRGTRNQKNGSWEPKRRSFFVKSTADSVAFEPQCKKPDLVCAESLELAKDSANTDIARSATST